MASKEFEVGDVLPATTQLRIIADIPNAGWDGQGGAYTTNQYLRVYTYDDSGGADYGFDVKVNGSFLTLSNYNLSKLVNNEWVSCEYVEYSIMSIIIDTSTWTETQRTIVNVSHPIYWEDLNAPSGFSITYEENGGSSVSQTTNATELPSPLPTTTKANHVFAGWYYDNLFTQKATAGDELTANVTLYAKWYTPTTWCEDIADAIREKEGSSDLIKHVDFADRIEALPSPKEEETKTVTPDFSSGNVVITPTTGKVLSQVTINKDANFIAENLKKDVIAFGLTGTSYIAIEITQAQYDALTTPDTNTYYIVMEEE